MKKTALIGMTAALVLGLGLSACSTTKAQNRAKEAAARYWQDKAYPGKSFDVQVIEAEKADDGMWRVKGIVDGETRTGLFNPETENFSEGYYSLAAERNRKIAELEEQVKYWKEKAEGYEKDIYKMKVQMEAQGIKGSAAPASATTPSTDKKDN